MNKVTWVHGSKKWVLYREALEIKQSLLAFENFKIKLKTHSPLTLRGFLHFGDRYEILKNILQRRLTKNKNISLSWHHGNPKEVSYNKLFEDIFAIYSIVNFIVPNEKVFYQVKDLLPKNTQLNLIPLGVNLDTFRVTNKFLARKELNLPLNSFIIGSFQEDDEGWGEKKIPKFIKGPDTLIKTALNLKNNIKDLHFLLTGPSRNYVREALELHEISYSYFNVKSQANLVHYYNALDIYLISSREEGGPKSLLEASACGVPVVSTNVGMASDFIKHETNGLICEVEDHNMLAEHAYRLYSDRELRNEITNQVLLDINQYNWKKISRQHLDTWKLK